MYNFMAKIHIKSIQQQVAKIYYKDELWNVDQPSSFFEKSII